MVANIRGYGGKLVPTIKFQICKLEILAQNPTTVEEIKYSSILHIWLGRLNNFKLSRKKSVFDPAQNCVGWSPDLINFIKFGGCYWEIGIKKSDFKLEKSVIL